ncbi:AraC family transcriptional regulator [Phytoactinopolyspora limicola]|uniref:AraC family transcriptional regulator n=1 Tax=Phytoactinopolyspora limicola TaxID=2715536 RepID=UPI001409F5A7|nr:AraC family transcriptional regulator [Phytoactinopolyspora limicola]
MRVDRATYNIQRWPGMRSEYSWLPPDRGVTVTKPFQIGVSFSTHDRLVYTEGGRARYLAVPAGSVFVTGTDEVSWAEVPGPTEALEIYPDLELLRTAAEVDDVADVEIEPAAAVRDATVFGLAAALRRAHLARAGVPDDMYASTLAHRLVTHLVEHYCPARLRRRRRNGRLDRVLVDRIAAFVDDRLSEPLVLDDLAAQARLSPFHFARAFKATTGLAPHEFVTLRRLERAKALLLSTGLSGPDVAYAVGYSNVGHFRRLLRRHTGFTPSALRSR